MGESLRQLPSVEVRSTHGTQTQAADSPPVHPVLQELSPRPDDVVIDLAAGDGHFSMPIAGRLDALQGHGKVFAFDASSSKIHKLAAEARVRGLSERFQAVCLDEIRPKTLPFRDDSVNAVLAVNVLQYMADPVSYLKEIDRVLTSYGSLLILDWQRAPEEPFLRTSPFRASPEQMLCLLEKAGLKACLQIDMKGYAWAIRAVKSMVALA